MVLGVLVLVIGAASGGFFYGLSTGQKQAATTRQQTARGQFGGQQGVLPRASRIPQAGEPGNARMGGGIMGQIEAVEGDALRVTTQEGSIRVLTTSTTLIEKYVSVGVDQLEIGEQVIVSGSRSDDGDITARSIQVPSLSAGQRSDQP